jgi:hypothetical protein
MMGERSELGASSPGEAAAFVGPPPRSPAPVPPAVPQDGAPGAPDASDATPLAETAQVLDNRAPGGAPGGAPGAVRPRPTASARALRWVAGLVLLGLIGGVIVASIGQPEPPTVVVRLPAATAPASAAAPGAVPAAAPTAVSDPVSPVFNAPVLGAMRPVWIEARGQPSQGVFGDLFAATTGVRWRDDGAGRQRAMQVELLTGSAPVPVGQARELAARFHPRDGQRVGVYVDTLGETVEVFRSAALAEVFGGADSPAAKAAFGAEPAGTYIQIAERGSSRTTRVLLALGTTR